MKYATHGTINILVGNEAGIVLVTDSRASTPDGHPVTDRMQKLFQLDSKTVCSIAGFGTNPGPTLVGRDASRSQPLALNSGSVILGFAKMLQSDETDPKVLHKPTFTEKVDGLSGELALEISGLQTENLFASSGVQATDDSIDLLVAGYDLDGKLRMAKRAIKIVKNDRTPDVSSYEGLITGSENIEIIGNKIQHLVSGYKPAYAEVEDRLEHPDSYLNEPEIKTYLSSKRKTSKRPLTVQQLGKLAEHLEDVAVKAPHNSASVIGGPVQKAVLRSRKVSTFQLGEVDAPPESKPTRMIENLKTFGGDNPIFGPPDTPMIYVNYSCTDAAIFLDNAVILGGHFENCLLYYFGKPFYIDPNDVFIKTSVLVIPSNYPDQWRDEVLKILPGTTAKLLDEVQSHPRNVSKPAPQ